jgi:hypothetical protein
MPSQAAGRDAAAATVRGGPARSLLLRTAMFFVIVTASTVVLAIPYLTIQ